MSTEKFSAEREIRLLDLLPGAHEDPIQCEIRITHLDSRENYEALSYVWGEQAAKESVWISGIERRITANLHDALKQLRYSSRKRTLWIDQLCINQWDIAEKSKQVESMRQICKNCVICLIWLGQIKESAGFSQRDAQAAP